jgi:outer membrane protein assembly factor BamD
MSSTRRTSISGLLLLASIAGVFSIGGFGCSSADVDENDPAALMKEAEEDIDSSRYLLAVEKLQKVKNQHPYSKQAVDAQLRIADVYFLQENYAESAATYEAFRDLHPKHPRLPYAAYRVGLAFFSDLPGNHARDLSSGYKAQDAFKDYLAHFPTDENVAAATAKLLETRKILAEKEMYIGNFYYKREMWEAAKGRFTKVLNLYADTPSVDDAKTRLKDIETKPPEKTE